jgi:membrane associated rhomboid family serine protease
MTSCYRHPSRETGVSCSSCGRPICPDCMTPTSVGMRCPECASQRTRVVRLRDVSDIPRVTYGLIAINVVAYLVEKIHIGGGETLYFRGALLGSPEIPGIEQGVAYGQWWRLVTGGFLHANLLHIGMNMLILYWLGRMLEPAIGSVRLAAVYITSLFAGAFGALVLTPHAFTVGASGAVFGLAGCAVVEMRSRNISIMESGLGMLIGINLLFSFTSSGISVGGHIGGLIGGALAGLVLQVADRRKSLALALAGCLVLSGVFAAASELTARSSEVTGSGEQRILIPGG